ncbi:MAG: hypothetical protein HOO91_02910 [Bacteroidales bacterium]|nr:hypothetical protein [Bacteroidales bacterium]
MKKAILITTIIAGSLDISAAFIQSYFMYNVMPSGVLQFISSGILGSAAYSGGFGIIALGLLVHYLIALSCTACFFWLYPKWRIFNLSIWLNSVLIALITWVVTSQIIVPLSRIKHRNFDVHKAFIALTILVICIGIPIAYFAKKYYEQKDQ